MPEIHFSGQIFQCDEGETVLQALMRQGVYLPFSCRSGHCQTCMLRAVNGSPTEESQAGLEEELRRQGYFLACSCRATEDIEVALPDY